MKQLTYQGDSQKISKYIAKELPFLNYFAVQKLFRKGDIRINDKKIYVDTLVVKGDSVKVYYTEAKSYNPTVIYEDDNIVVYHKPVKIPSDGDNSFADKINSYVNSSYILCHRLDTNTEGLLLFAKNNEIFEIIKQAFKNHEISKYYLACVNGNIDKTLELHDYLVKDSEASKVEIFHNKVNDSVAIITKVVPVKNCGTHTYVEVELITGKTHQIRAHLASIGNFVIGDGKYGKEDINNQFKAHTQALIAYKLVFNFSNAKLSYLNKNIIEIKNIDKFFKY